VTKIETTETRLLTEIATNGSVSVTAQCVFADTTGVIGMSANPRKISALTEEAIVLDAISLQSQQEVTK
jgi:hypothetical protein